MEDETRNQDSSYSNKMPEISLVGEIASFRGSCYKSGFFEFFKMKGRKRGLLMFRDFWTSLALMGDLELIIIL